MAKLIIERGKDKGRELELSDEVHAFLGRGDKSELAIDDGMASRRHCVVTKHKGSWVVKDLGSSNGTILNGRTLETDKTYVLKHGFMIQIGETAIAFENAAPREKDPLLGVNMGGYLIEKKLGRGAMGIVYQAHQVSLDRDVALKILSSDIAHDERFTAMFIEEAKAAAKFNHPNILQVYDVAREGDQFFIAMEIAPGGTVLEELRREGQIPVNKAVDIVKGTLRALAYAEKKGIVHRDIKPDNLMIGGDGVVKLGDLGLAASSAELNGEDSGVFGTPHYIAPEQAQGKAIDHRADLYALGATWYRLLSGQTLFSGGNVRDILRNQVRTKHRSLLEVMPDVPAALSRIIDQMLEKEPDERYQSADDVLEDIQLWESNVGIASDAIVASKGANRKGEVIGEQGGNGRVIVLAGVLALLVCGVAAFFLFGKDDKQKDDQIAKTKTNANSGEQPNKEPEVNDPQEAIDLLSDAKAISFDPQRQKDAIELLQQLVEEYPKSKSAKEGKPLLEQLQSVADKRANSISAFERNWELLDKSLREEIVKEFKFMDARRKFNEFIEGAKDQGIDEVSAFATKLLADKALDKIERVGRLEFKSQIQGLAASTAREPRSLQKFENAIAAILELERKVDIQAPRDFANGLRKGLVKSKKAFENELRDQERRRIAESFTRAERAFGEASTMISGHIQKSDFKGAEEALERFATTQADYVKDASNHVFDDLRQRVADRRRQTLEAKAALDWILPKWETSKPLQIEANSALEKAFGAKSKSFLLIKNEDTIGRFKIGVKLDGLKIIKNYDEKDFLSKEACAAILAYALEDDGVGKLLDSKVGRRHRMALAAYLLELGGAAVAGRVFDAMHDQVKAEPKAMDEEFNRRLWEYRAWSILARAGEAKAQDNLAQAQHYIGLLESEFKDSRANKH